MSVGLGVCVYCASGSPFSEANGPSLSMKFLKDDGLRLKEPSGSEMLLLISLNLDTSRWLIVRTDAGTRNVRNRGAGRRTVRRVEMLPGFIGADNVRMHWRGRRLIMG